MKDDYISFLIKKYKEIHPLVIKRTINYTKSLEESVYMLDNLPPYPIAWDIKQKKWKSQNATINKTK